MRGKIRSVRPITSVAFVVLAWLGGCSTPPDRIILLPDPEGKVGAVVVRSANTEQTIDFANLLCCYYIFIRFGLLVDAAAIFIILSAVMGCFFSSALLHAQEQAKAEAAQAAEPEAEADGNDRRGSAPSP